MKERTKMKRTILAILLTGIGVKAYAATYTDGDWEFEAISENAKTARIVKYIGAEVNVNVPSSVKRSERYKDNDGEYHTRYINYVVISLGSGYVFENHRQSLNSVNLPSSIIQIEGGVFACCLALESCVMPCVSKVGSQAFKGCSTLIDVEGDNIEFIDYWAFQDCRKLSNVNLRNVKTIGFSAFENCSALTGDMSLDAATSIGNSAFKGTGIVSVKTSSNLHDLGSCVFMNCKSLKNVEINGDGNVVIQNSYEDGMFEGSSALETCILGDGVVEIKGHAFDGCSSLRKVSLGLGIKKLPYGLFVPSSVLETVEMSSVDNIDSTTFKGCRNLKNIDLANVKIIGGSAFEDCSALTGDMSLDAATSIGNSAFKGTGIVSVKTSSNLHDLGSCVFMNCKSLKNVEINGDGNVVIRRLYEDGMFENCSALESCTFGDGVSKIEGHAFDGCWMLRKVKFGANVESVESQAFPNVSCEYFFTEGVPLVGNYNPFGGSGSNARYGYYTAEYAAEWVEVIPSSGVWNYLIMKKAKQPKLEIISVDWVNGSIKLDWSKGEDGEEVNWPCTLYRGTSPSFVEAEAVKGAIGTTETSFTDVGFLSTAPHTAPLYYWVKPDNSEMPYAPSLPVVTRKRYGLFVGMNAPYEGNWQKYYPSMQSSTRAVTDLFGGFGFEFDDIKWNLTGEMLSREIVRLVDKCNKGDICLMWINTHGTAEETEEGVCYSGLTMHSKGDFYSSARMANDLARFGDSVAVIPVVFACHAEGLINSSAYFDARSYCGDSLPPNISFVAACAVSQTSPGASGGANQHDSFPLFLINSAEMAEDKNGDGYISLGEMSDYIYKQQLLFTPYATLVAPNREFLDNLIMKKCEAVQQGSAPGPITGLYIDYEAQSSYDDSEIMVKWDESSQSDWFSVQCPALQLSDLIYRAQLGIKRNILAKGYGKDLIFTVYAGNKYGRSAGREISYKASNAILDCYATSDRADGILVSWNFIGIETIGVSMYRRINKLGDSWQLLAVVPAGDGQSYLDDTAIAGIDYAYKIVPLQNEIKENGTCAGYRYPEYRLIVTPAFEVVQANDTGFHCLTVTANAKVEMTKVGDFVFTETFKNGPKYFRCEENSSYDARDAKIIFRLAGTDVSKTVTITQLGADDKRCEEKALSAFMSRKNIKSEARLSEDADGNGLPDLFDYAFQDNEDEAKEALCKIEMKDGKPKVSIPKQNIYTTRDVDVYIVTSEDMQSWSRMEDEEAVETSAKGNREIHSPKESSTGRNFFKVRAAFR